MLSVAPFHDVISCTEGCLVLFEFISKSWNMERRICFPVISALIRVSCEDVFWWIFEFQVVYNISDLCVVRPFSFCQTALC